MGQLPELLTVAEVAALFRVTDETIHRKCRKRELEYIRVIGSKRFRRDYIEGLLAVTPTEAGDAA